MTIKHSYRRTFMRIHPVLFLVFFGLSIGLIAAVQNLNFYHTYSAFYDSMAYLNQLAWVMENTQSEGFWVTVADSYTHSTVFLPWLFGALLSYVAEPSRMLGIAIQMPLIFLQLFTGYRFFLSTGASPWRAAVYALPLIAYPAIFYFNGGLSDLRMDLSQALTYGSFLAALMVARKKDSLKEWVFVGLIISVACLYRATTPVYVVVVLSMTFLLDLQTLGLNRSLRRYSLIGVVVTLLTGWFYLLNYNHLYYYYFIWNTDANAHLPLHESLMHINFIIKHIGIPLLTVLLIAMLITSYNLIKHCQWRLLKLNWVALVGTLVPATYLVFSGAGLNPFVSMVSVPGLILFSLHMAECDNLVTNSHNNQIFPTILSVILIYSIFTSIKNSNREVSTWIPYKQGAAKLIDSVEHDAELKKTDHIMLAFLYLGSVDEAVITNHLIYEEGYKYKKNHTIIKNKTTIEALRYGFGAEAEWKEIPGTTDQEKLNYVTKDALVKANYIIMADEGSDLPSHHRINHYAQNMRSLLENSNAVEKLESGIILSKTEKVTVYRVK